MKLTEQISAVVTGGASGLGEAVVRYLRSKQVKTALFDSCLLYTSPSPRD